MSLKNDNSIDSSKNHISSSKDENLQYSIFKIAGRHFGIDVTRVQEVVRPMIITHLPLAPNCLVGMINLRGQIATAISLPVLFKLNSAPQADLLNVVCKSESLLLSFLVEEIGDVQEFELKSFEPPPTNIDYHIRKFMKGIFKTDDSIISILDVDVLIAHLKQLNYSDPQAT